MPTLTAPRSQAHHDPLAAFRQRGFRLYASNRLLSASASTMLQAALAWQVYAISHSALQLGVLGLVRFVPALVTTLFAGALADSLDRRKIVIVTQASPILCALALLAATDGGAATLPLIYALTFLVALASAFENPARQALLPQVVTREVFPNAVTVNSTVQQLGFVVGPAVAGGLIAVSGVAAAYAGNAVLEAVAVLAMLPVRPAPFVGERRRVSIAAIREGIHFVRSSQVLLGAMSLDMFAVIFGGAQALLPVYATNILHVGATGYGVLTASQAVGALAMSVALIALPPVRRTGRGLLIAILFYGLATVGFGLSRVFALSVFAYALTGVADQVSVIMRQTTIQLATPDALRGRVSAVGSLFVGASNQVGAVESGIVAALTTATFSVVSGGIGCLSVLAAVTAFAPELRRYDIHDSHHETQRRAAEAAELLADAASGTSP